MMIRLSKQEANYAFTLGQAKDTDKEFEYIRKLDKAGIPEALRLFIFPSKICLN